MSPLLLAHRGLSSEHPENTAPALRAALEAADGLEVDVRLSGDGAPFLFHDDETTALTGSPGTVEARSAAEIAALRVRGEPLARLDDLIALWRPPAFLNVELKPSPRADLVVDACRPLLDPIATRPDAPLVVSTFDPRIIAAAIRKGVPWRLALLYEQLSSLRALAFLPDDPPLDLHPHHSLLDERHLAEYARPGRVFRAWTVDDPGEARRLVSLPSAPLAAIITNVPGLIRRSLATRS